MKTRILGLLDRFKLEGGKGVQVVDKEDPEEIHQQCAEAEGEKAEKGDWMGAKTPVEVALLWLKGLLFHGADNSEN